VYIYMPTITSSQSNADTASSVEKTEVVSTDQSWLQIAVIEPAFDGRCVLLPEVEVAI